MNIRNCKKCGKIFNYINGPVMCANCREDMEAKFQEVKAYIRENKGVGINEVAEACDVDPQQITAWLRDERLEVTEDSALMLNCDSCGAPIRSGKLCERCKGALTGNLRAITDAAKPKPQQPKRDPKENPKMRFLDT